MTTLRSFDLNSKPTDGQRRLVNIVSIELEPTFQKFDYDARELHLQPGDRVIAETERGPSIATVRSWTQRRLVGEGQVLRVLRKANELDEKHAQRNRESEIGAYRFAIERIRARKLPMKLVRAQWLHDGSKIVFYFSADGRVDFRDLVKDLAHQFRTRIEMYQIGVRDGARMIGGIGPCGRELCCSTFLENFAPVSIRMAKDQGLTLNPAKVSGMCGRLMCCLVYEQQLYRRMKKRLPRANTAVRTRMGRGTVIDVDVINRRVNVELTDGNRKLFGIEDVVIGDADDDEGYVDSVGTQPEYQWDDEFGATARPDGAKSGAKKSSSGRRRRRRGRGRGNKKGKKK